MKDFASRNGVAIAKGNLYMSSDSVQHAVRTAKKKAGKDVSEAELVAFPKTRRSMDLYYETTKGAFIYVDEANKAKYVIEPNYEIGAGTKGKKRVNFITASRLKSTENFHNDTQRYIKI